MATRKRYRNFLDEVREFIEENPMSDDEIRALLTASALKILNDTDLQNARYDDFYWDAMIDGDEGKDFTPDELPGAVGEFGRDVNNPIPANGATGEVTYLSKLMWLGGAEPQNIIFHRLGSRRSQVFDRMIDIFEVVSIDGQHYDILYVDMYHVEQSKKAPEGYKLLSEIYGITGDSVGPMPEFPAVEAVLERAFDYAINAFGAPLVNPAVQEVNEEVAIETANKHRQKSLDIEGTVTPTDMDLPKNFVPLSKGEEQELLLSLLTYKSKYKNDDSYDSKDSYGDNYDSYEDNDDDFEDNN